MFFTSFLFNVLHGHSYQFFHSHEVHHVEQCLDKTVAPVVEADLNDLTVLRVNASRI